jgi:hypothetical protein
MPELAPIVFFASRETLSYLLRLVFCISPVRPGQIPGPGY